MERGLHADLPVTDAAASRTLALPMFPGLTDAEQDQVIAAVRELFGNPVTPVTHHIWPMDHPVAAAWLYTAILLVGGYLLAQRRYRARTTE